MDLEHFFDDLLEVREKTLKVDMDANAIDNLVRDLPDLDFARGVGSAVGTLGIAVEDVMLAGPKSYYSFRDEGTM